MSAAANTLENGLLALILNNVNLANIGDATGLRGSSTAGSLYVGLHTDDPGEAGTQETNEAAYTNYARVAIARSGSAWTITGNSAVNAAAVTFPQSGSGPEVITHFSIGTASSGAGTLLFKGELDDSLTVNNLIQPAFAAGVLEVTCD